MRDTQEIVRYLSERSPFNDEPSLRNISTSVSSPPWKKSWKWFVSWNVGLEDYWWTIHSYYDWLATCSTKAPWSCTMHLSDWLHYYFCSDVNISKNKNAIFTISTCLKKIVEAMSCSSSMFTQSDSTSEIFDLGKKVCFHKYVNSVPLRKSCTIVFII